MRLCFLDLETTGLDPEVDEITEAAWIVQDYSGRWVERQFFVEHTRLPNEWVLKKSDYVTRILPAYKYRIDSVLCQLEQDVQSYGKISTRPTPAHIAGCNPAFDHAFLRKAYRQRAIRLGATSLTPPYHFRLVDVEAIVVGAFGLDAMPGANELRRLLGIPGNHEAAHTALGDAREAKVAFESAMRRVADDRVSFEIASSA